jgi:hypothetical protein
MGSTLKITRPHVIAVEVQGKFQVFHGTHTTLIKVIHDDKYGKNT